MSENDNLFVIRADPKVKEKFKQKWREFNNKILGKMTQGEYLDYILEQICKPVEKED